MRGLTLHRESQGIEADSISCNGFMINSTISAADIMRLYYNVYNKT